MSKLLTKEEILEQHSDSRYSISHPFTGQDIIEAMQQYADQECAILLTGSNQEDFWEEVANHLFEHWGMPDVRLITDQLKTKFIIIKNKPRYDK